MVHKRRVLVVGYLLLGLLAISTACGMLPPATGGGSATTNPAPALIDIHTPDDLKARFNQDAGMPRIILLVSPT